MKVLFRCTWRVLGQFGPMKWLDATLDIYPVDPLRPVLEHLKSALPKVPDKA